MEVSNLPPHQSGALLRRIQVNMAQNADVDYFSQKGTPELQVEVTVPAAAHGQDVSKREEISKITLSTPLHTPPAPPSPFGSSQTAHSGGETPPSHDVPYVYLQSPPPKNGSPNPTTRERNATSSSPKLQIDTNVKPGSFSLSSQTTPYSDATLFSGFDSGPNYEAKMKLEDQSPKNRPRSNSEPPKAFRPPPSLKPSVSLQSQPEPHDSRSQSSFAQSTPATTPHVIRTPATPNALSRSGSRRKHHAFVAHNPFTTHNHPEVVAKHEKPDLTFDQIQTPTTRPTPRVAFASGHEDAVGRGDSSTSRDYYTPSGSRQYPLHPTLERSVSERKDLRRAESSIHSSTGARRSSSLRIDPTHARDSDRRDSVFSSTSVTSDYTEDSTTDYEGHNDVLDHDSDNLSNHAPQKSPYPINRRRDPFKHEDDLYDDEKGDSLSRPSLPRQDTLESSSGYSIDEDLEKKGDINKVLGHPFKSKEVFVSSVVQFVGSTLPRQLYLHFLLRLPLLYFSRVSRIFEEADLTLPEIKRMALEIPQSANKLTLSRFDLSNIEAADIPLEYQSLSATWQFFIDSLLREWKVTNIVSGLLLSAILTLLQIEGAASNPFIRFTSLFSLICALISLLYGCMYIIRFGTMRKPYKAAEWALEARNKAMIWWNVWVLLAMPAIWLTWSIILYIVCIMAFAWQTTSQVNANPSPLSPNVLLGVRILLSVVLGLGILYGALIITTFSRYGEVMDRTWKERIDEWAEEKATATSAATTSEYPLDTLSDHRTGHSNTTHTPTSSAAHPPPDYFIPNLDSHHRIRLPPPHEFSAANLGKKPSLSKEKRRVRFESPRDSPADSLGESVAFDPDAESESEVGERTLGNVDDVVAPSERED